MHNSPNTDATEKKKPTVIEFYIQNKIGVVVFDQMVEKYASRLSPFTIWTNILDITTLN